MRRKVIQDYANKVCEMFVGWRLAVSKDDIPRLIDLGSGTIDADLLVVSMRLNGVDSPPLGIVHEIAEWLRDRCLADGVPYADLLEAQMSVSFRASERKTRRSARERSLEFECVSRIATSDRTYEGSLSKGERWTTSGSGAPWIVRDE